MFNIWRRIPVVRLLLPFSAGILTQLYHPLPVQFWILLLGFNLALLTAVVLWSHLRNYAGWLFNTVLIFLFSAFGGILVQLNTATAHPDHFGKIDRIELVDAVLTTTPEMGKNSYKTTLKARAVYADGKLHHTSGEFLMYVSKVTELDLQKGDRILLTRAPRPVEGPKNPGEFDYRQYLFNHGITHQVYLKDPSQAILIKSGYEQSVLDVFDHSRQWLVGRLREALKDDDSFGVSMALILGQKEFLSPQIRSAYSGTGAMHVLAVSGLHVGIIYLILMTGLKFLGKSKMSMWVRLVLILAGLWSYAIITGLSPSVMRAATMFSAVAIAQNISRKTNIYNTLASAALILLCVNPYLLLEVGFQLSFLAVLGIVLIQPHIYLLATFNSRVPDKLWQLTSVSIAAQIATFPLGILYFHQFPNYFLLSNFIVIPAAFVVLTLGMALMVSSVINPLFEVLGNLLNAVVYALNFSVKAIESLPHALTSGLYINHFETMVIYIFLAFVIAFIYHRRVHFILAVLFCGLMLLTSFSWRLYEQKSTPLVAVNHVSGNMTFSFMDGTQNILVADSVLLNDDNKLAFHLKNYWYSRGFEDAVRINLASDSIVRFPGFYKCGNYISFHGYHIKYISDETPDDKTHYPEPAVDLLVMGGKSKLPPETNCKQIALCSSYRYRSLCCDSTDVPYFDVRNQGALLIPLPERQNLSVAGLVAHN